MAASQRPGEITYYEELGVDHTASPEEIREAFRTLVRLLHPDQQTDPQLRMMAEFQMRKLNRIHAVLSDPARRTAYDESLTASRGAPIIVFSGSDGNLKKLLARFGFAGAILFGTLFLIWFMATSNNTEVRGQDARASAAAKTNDAPADSDSDGDAPDEVARLRDQLRAAEGQRDSALAQLGRLDRKETDPAVRKSRAPGIASSATAINELPSVIDPPAVPSTASAVLAPPFQTTRFTGVWVYAKSSGSAVSPGGTSQYPPEFIEVTLTESNGALRGQYRSRYQVLDHAISPDVNFDFSGVPVGSSLNCAWNGPGGAKGRVTMKFSLASTVEIAWNATELGSQQWLVNGTATLVRK